LVHFARHATAETRESVDRSTHQQLLTEAIAFPPDVTTAKSRRQIAGRTID
jgi:hypothetical protein